MGNYTPDRELNPPNDDHKQDLYEDEKCVDCGEDCDDMRYAYDYSYFGSKLNALCPICQQERIVNDLQLQLSAAVKELELRKLTPNK